MDMDKCAQNQPASAIAEPAIDKPSAIAKPLAIVEPLTKADRLSLACGLALALLWTVCDANVYPTGIFTLIGGMALSACLLAFLACAWFLRSKRDPQASKRRLSKWSYALLACTALLMCVPAFSQAAWIRILNAFALAVTLPLTYLLICKGDDTGLFGLHGLEDGATTFLTEQFRNWPVIRRILSSSTHGHGRTIGGVAAGAGCALGIMVVVVPALCSADGNFAWIVEHIDEALNHIDLYHCALNAIGLALLTPIAFSLLFALHHPHPKVQPFAGASLSHASAPTAALGTMLAMLDVVYLVFVAIQSSYLFGGVDTLKRFGGYAAYARAGFFQLVAVTAINLVIVMACIHLRRGQERAVSLLCLELVLLASTVVMLVSAAWRMSLYVGEYGLTRLRLLTYWGMVAIAFLLAVTVLRLLRPRTNLFRLALFGVVGLWLVFAFAQPDLIIAEVNVDGYLSGGIERIDVDYLGQLPSEASGSISRLGNEAPSKTMRQDAAQALDECRFDGTWAEWGI
ncbi:DUF4173 domain-containing protein [Bifidobacterium sp. ESL0763]|uniref:DUF4153 domain-containing protein n=1 Tax=Bifidobacterium sp. ESL0763 TaxID=2983227 RepID=UPI0023F91C1E|nr:DUF4173 domain-containing protein [Bifidobacterium sp. ESL0763]MDF7663948.1 DUF4173 domain-containing protein [Bifidobacterium sp. ESL0763]